MTERMADLGTPAVGPPRQVYSWGISMVLRAPTADGLMFLKCSSPLFANEAVLTALLAEATPDLVTRVVAIEPDEGWLLMHDHGDRMVGEDPGRRGAPRSRPRRGSSGSGSHGPVSWNGTVPRCARSARSLGGCPRSRTAAARDRAVRDRPRRVAGRDASVLAACERLEAIGPAPTVSHGDLHPWNVAATPSGPRIFDWTDTAVTHPFLDLAVYATRPRTSRSAGARDAYLAHWADQLAPAALAEAGELALVVGTLYQVESYVRILTTLDPDDAGGLAGAMGSWARAAVLILDEGIAIQRPGHADG